MLRTCVRRQQSLQPGSRGLAKVLGIFIEELLGIGDGAQRAKRGPKSQLERQLEAVATLPRNQQQKILAVVEALIAHHAER